MDYTTRQHGRWPLALILAWPALGAVAQPAADLPNDATQLDAVEVRAQKRVQTLDEVPISMQLLDGTDLSEQGIKDTSQLGGQAANVKITQNTAEGTAPAITIRGVGNLDYNTSTTSPVGVYVDGVGGGTGNRHLANLYDVESVEILRGPQGTLFGRNTTAGALLVNTRRPVPGLSEGYLEAGVGNYDSTRLGGAWNLPLGDNLALRAAFDERRYDYTVNNLYPPAPEPRMHQTEGRISLLAQTDAVEVYLKLHGEDWDGVSKPVRHIGVIRQPGNPPTPCTPSQAGSNACTDFFGFNVGSNDLNDVAANSNDFDGFPHHRHSSGADLTLTFPLDERSYLVSVSSFNALERLHHYNADASPARRLEGSLHVDGDVWTQELRYHLDAGPAYFIAGAFWLEEPLEQRFFIDILRDFRALPDLFSQAAMFLYDNEIDTRSQALFANVDYDLDDVTTLTAGLRYTRESVDYRAIGQVNVATAVGDLDGSVFPAWDVAGDVDDGQWSGKLALHRHWSDTASNWISVSRGFKSGGYNGAIAFSAEEARRNDYGSETLSAYEIGGVAYFNERRARLQYAAFVYDYRDQQVFMNTPSEAPGGLPLQLLDNVGRSRIHGAELELAWQPSDPLELRLGLGWLPKAELESFVNAQGNEVRGNRLPLTSEWNANAFIDYRIPAGEGEWLLQLNGNYQSKFYSDQNQNDYTAQDGYTLWNARVAYERGPWTAALWVKNLFDQEYTHLRFDLINFLGLVQDNRGEQRQFGLDLGWRF